MNVNVKSEFDGQAAQNKGLEARLAPLKKSHREAIQAFRANEDATKQLGVQAARAQQQFDLSITQLRTHVGNLARDRLPPQCLSKY